MSGASILKANVIKDLIVQISLRGRKFLLGVAVVAVAGAGLASFVLVGRSDAPTAPVFSDVTPGYPMPDVSAISLILYFGLKVPAVPYTYSGSMHDEEGGPLLRLVLHSSCSGLIDYASANHLARVDVEFIGDGTAMVAASAAGWQYGPNSLIFGRAEEISGASYKLEMILMGSGANCQGFVGAS